MISKWHLKAATQKALSLLPSPEKANHWFQKNITKGVRLNDEHLGYKIRHARDHIRYFRKYGRTGEECTVMELGTGWYPIVPVMIFLTETAGRVISVDIHNWLSRENFIHAVARIGEWKGSGKLNEAFGAINEERWQELSEMASPASRPDLGRLKKLIGLETRLEDARTSGVRDETVDLICSNNTFEHIYPETLGKILSAFKRVIRPGGVMSHFIDMSDHFAHFDRSITVYHFLRYSERFWRWIDNSIQPQNRMRFRDYLDMYKELDIRVTETEIWPYEKEILGSEPVHDEWSDYTTDELAVTHGYIISQF